MSWLISRALLEDYANSLCSQEQVEEYSEASFSAGGLSAALRLTPTAQVFLPSGKTTAFSKLSRYGMTCAPLTECHGEGLLTWFREASRVRTSVSPGAGSDWRGREAGSGENLPESLAKFDPATRSWRTAQRLLFEASTECLVTLPRWGTVRPTVSLEPMMLVPPTGGNGSGLWPNNCERSDTQKEGTGIEVSIVWRSYDTAEIQWTVGGLHKIYEAEILFQEVPRCRLDQRGCNSESVSLAGKENAQGCMRALRLAEQLASSPQGQGFIEQHAGEFADALRELSQSLALAGARGLWHLTLGWELFPLPTWEPPTCGNEYGLLLPTPNCSMDRMCCPQEAVMAMRGDSRADGSKITLRIQDFLAEFGPIPTPTKSMAKGATIQPRKTGKIRMNDRLDYWVMAHFGGKSSSLSPLYPEWVMGWPSGWTSLEPLAMDKFQQWLRLHGRF